MKTQLENLLADVPNVKFAYLFGSHADSTMRENSDMDLAIYIYDDTLEKQLDLHHALQKTLQKEVDIVNLNRIKNLYLLESIFRDGIVLKDHEEREYYEACRQHEILDFKAFQKMIHAAQDRSQNHLRRGTEKT